MAAPGTCSVCRHPRRVEIDRAIHRGVYSSEIGRRFGLTKPTVTGHRRSAHHLLHTPRQGTSPHTAEGLLERIGTNLDDREKLRDLRLAVLTLPHGERLALVAELRRRAGVGGVAEPVEEAAA